LLRRLPGVMCFLGGKAVRHAGEAIIGRGSVPGPGVDVLRTGMPSSGLRWSWRASQAGRPSGVDSVEPRVLAGV
jgi:hypothetical protein